MSSNKSQKYLEGYLIDKGLMMSDKRWVVLENKTLHLYAPKETLDINKYSLNRSDGKPYFELLSRSKAPNKQFIAESEEEVDAWLDAISSNASSQNFNLKVSNNNDEKKQTDHEQWQYIYHLKHKVENLETASKEKDEQLKLQNVSIKKYRKQLNELNVDAEDKQNRLNHKHSQNSTLSKRVQSQINKINSLKDEMNNKDDSIDELKKESQNKSNTITTLQTQLSDTNKREKDNKETIDRLSKQLENKDSTINTVRSELYETSDTVTILSEQLQHSTSEAMLLENRENGNIERQQLLEGKKGWLTFITVIIAMCSFFSSLGLSKFFGTNDIWNGRIAMGTSILSLVLTFIKFSISYITFGRHYHNDNGIEDDLNKKMIKNKKSHQFLMKAIYVTVSTINDCTFDILQGIAAITGQPYSYNAFVVLLAATWFGAIEEFGELIVEIFFDTSECECLCCTPVKSYSVLLVWSYIESVVGIYLLTTYDNDILKYTGIALELVLGNLIVLSLFKFRDWSKRYRQYGRAAVHIQMVPP